MSQLNEVDIIEVDGLMMQLPIEAMREFIKDMGPITYKEWVEFTLMKFLCVEYNLTMKHIESDSADLDSQEQMKPKFTKYIATTYGLDKKDLSQVKLISSITDYCIDSFLYDVVTNPASTTSEYTILLKGQRMNYGQILNFLQDARVVEE